MRAETRYAKNGDVHIAYQVLGEGPLDLVLVHGWVQSFDARTEIEPIERFYRRLASFSRLILFDKRGTGLSDRVPLDDLPTLETRMDDMRAVMDEVGVERAAVLGHSEGGAMCALFAATYPDRTQALVMSGASARTRWAPDYPLGATDDALEELQRLILDNWGYEGVRSLLETMAPSIVDDEELVHAHTRAALRAASPAAAAALTQMSAMIDVRHVLPAIRVPTLVLYRADEMLAEASRYVGERIPGAKIVELPGNEHMPWLGDQDAALDEIEEFLTGFRPHPVLDRVLATVLFTDIVGSTELAADLGDRRWRELLEQHNELVRRELARFRGHELSRQATASWRRSTALAARSRAQSPYATRPRDSGSRSGSGSTPASSSSPARTSAGSPSTQVPASPAWQGRMRCWPRARSATSSPARASSSKTAGRTN
jgi:pimeloyl-ACP methyl ester carboxylesterase